MDTTKNRGKPKDSKQTKAENTDSQPEIPTADTEILKNAIQKKIIPPVVNAVLSGSRNIYAIMGKSEASICYELISKLKKYICFSDLTLFFFLQANK